MTKIGYEVEHPGVVLWEEYLKPMEITQTRLARDIDISYQRVNELINGKRGVTPDTALRLSHYLGTTAEFWLNWQALFDLQQMEKEHKDEYDRIRKVA
ncbi:MAG: HigA family addiction module antitoxin [Deltaproteobacteria bacterium]|nr:HigA family addiction module antitoxin [Deltaproteobacteria bacterium]